MIYLIVYMEFFKIGLFAVGGGLVTIPFLFELTERYSWFTQEQLVDIIGIVQSLPGPMGVNISSFVGYSFLGLRGMFTAGIALVTPPTVMMMFLAEPLKKHHNHPKFQAVMAGIRPATIALIMVAMADIVKIVIVDWKSIILVLAFASLMFIYKKSPVFYIITGALIGIIFKL